MAKPSDEKMRSLIAAAAAYRSGNDSINTVYMGSMATASLYAALGLRYGQPGFNERLAAADRPMLERAFAVCSNIIEYMQKHPTRKCPCCGGIVSGRAA